MITFPAACLALVLWAGSLGARLQDGDEFTRRITEELSAQDPEAAALFTQANAVRAREDAAEAERLYRAVLERVPDFVHATRRLSGVVANQGRRAEALTLARAACRAERTPENRSQLVALLALSTDAEKPTPAELA